MPVSGEPFLMIQNICPSETSFMVCEQVKLRGMAGNPCAIMPSPLPAGPWQILHGLGSAVHWYSDTPLLVVNSSDIDFVDNGGDLADLVREIGSMGQGVQHYVPLGSN